MIKETCGNSSLNFEMNFVIVFLFVPRSRRISPPAISDKLNNLFLAESNSVKAVLTADKKIFPLLFSLILFAVRGRGFV